MAVVAVRGLIETPFPADHLKPVHLCTIYKINKQLRYVHTITSSSKKLQMNKEQVRVYVIEVH